MKKIVFSLLAFAIVIAAKAQDIPERKMDAPGVHHMHDRGGMERHQKMMAMKGVQFTDQQKDQVKKGNEDFRTKMEALKKEDNITVKEYRTRMENLHKDHKAYMQSILTTDQKAQIEKNKTDMKGRHEEMARKREERMKTTLNLTDEQTSQLRKNREDISAKIRQIREDKSLSEDKKREEIRNEMKSQHEKMKSILTEEQKNKLKEMKQRKGDFKGKPGTNDKTKKEI